MTLIADSMIEGTEMKNESKFQKIHACQNMSKNTQKLLKI